MNQDSDSFFGDMTNYELVDLTISIQSANFEAVAIYLSVLSAYLVTAYLAAKSLTRFQLYSISTIYSVFMLMQLVQFVQLGNLQRNLVIYTTV